MDKYLKLINPYPAGTKSGKLLLPKKSQSLCHQYRAGPACTSVTRLYTVGWLTLFYMYSDIPKNDNGQFKTGSWIIQFKKFNSLRVKL